MEGHHYGPFMNSFLDNNIKKFVFSDFFILGFLLMLKMVTHGRRQPRGGVSID